MISVNIATKDRARLLSKALNSVVAQKDVVLEVVIINDGSTDDTDRVVGSFKSKFERLKYIKNPHSIGVSASRQLALLNSEGEFIANIDDDDEWVDNHKLSKQYNFLKANPEIGLVGTNARINSFESGQSYIWRGALDDSDIRERILYQTPFINTTIMFRKDLAIKAGGFGNTEKYLEDHLLWLKLGKLTKFANLDFIGTEVTSFESGLTRSNAAKILKLEVSYALKFRKFYPNFKKSLLKLLPQYIFVTLFGIENWYKLKKLYVFKLDKN